MRWPDWALVSAVLLPAYAGALEAGVDMDVFLDEEPAGIWKAQTLVRQVDERCFYRIRWSNGAPLAAARTRRCEIFEDQVGAHIDCEENSTKNFVTSVTLGPACRGFDSFLQEVEVEQLHAAEYRGGVVGTVLVSSSDDLQSFEVRARAAGGIP
jgi:hypothetical protein